MKSNTAVRVVDNNSHNSKAFTIQASGKMFHMVISGLYSNKPQSITREIWSNAYDAHAMVGKTDVPFEVTFPTALTPVFTCRDFGPGIAHEDMEGFYTVLGHSTKEDTNVAVGKWGVGRMSPMSYTDTFSVVSRHKGMIAYYSVQLGPDGSPQLHVLAPPSPTNDADGLEVSFPVKRVDIAAFQQAAELVSYGFTVPPRVTNSQDKQFHPIKKVFEGEGYYIYEDSRMSGSYAQMGCVIYPIPSMYVPRLLNIVYQFDIGDLEVTASREALSFGPNDLTAAHIKDKAVKVDQVLWQAMQDHIEAQPKLFDAARLAPKLRFRLTAKHPEFTYKGSDIPRYWKLDDYKVIDISCGYRDYRQKVAGWTMDRTLNVANDHKIFIQDTSDKRANARAGSRIFTKVLGGEYYLWVKAKLTDPAAKAEVDKLCSELGYPVHYIKDLTDPGPANRSRKSVSVSHICNKRRESYSMPDSEFTAGGYYYEMTNNEYPAILNNLTPLVKDKLGMDRIILVPKTLWKNFKAAPQWQPLMPALEAVAKLEVVNVQKEFGDCYNTHPFYRLSVFSDDKGEVGEFARKVLAYKPSNLYLGLPLSVWSGLLSHFKLPVPNNNKIRAEYQRLLDKYPLLELYDGSKNHLLSAFKDYLAAKE